MLGDVPRRRQDLGRRIAAKDLENCLEDTVSIFEAVLRAFVRRRQQASGMSAEEIERQNKRIGTGFQNVRRAADLVEAELGISLFEAISEEQVTFLARVFEKRHPITHNLGVVDRKYIEKARSAEWEGREVLVTASEITVALDLSARVFRSLHGRLFPQRP